MTKKTGRKIEGELIAPPTVARGQPPKITRRKRRIAIAK